jgi:hypothetical protein
MSAIGTGKTRAKAAFERRDQAADLAKTRVPEPAVANGEEYLYRNRKNQPKFSASFTKGLKHDLTTGLVVRPSDFQLLVRAVDSADPRDLLRVPLGPDCKNYKPVWVSTMAKNVKDANDPTITVGASVRGWENVGAGSSYDLEGPDAQSLAIPPAPTFSSPEMHFEMVEMYIMALVRDIPFTEWGVGPNLIAFNDYIDILNALPYIADPPPVSATPAELDRRRPIQSLSTIFRGLGPGVNSGPYVSQYLLIGNTGLGSKATADEAKGLIRYGSITINQKSRVAKRNLDYMTTWESFVDVQNGADLRGLDKFEPEPHDFRFIYTPRDLATWVHFDALYEAYLNACLILLAQKVPFDSGLPFQDPGSKQTGFGTFGGPHILSLVCEVATRALKSEWYQKFNTHRRCRPEAVGGLVHKFITGDPAEFQEVAGIVNALDPILEQVTRYNADQNANPDRSGDASAKEISYLLPMAFPEGSPMHPAYASGHATVAGACVTILKAFFDSNTKLTSLYVPGYGGKGLVNITPQEAGLDEYPTVAEELNKLAANISIGRGFAGVHYWTDYYEAILLGEKIAIGILEEQKLTYGENFFMTLPTFDGPTIRI